MTMTWIDTAGGPLICAAFPVGLSWRGAGASSISDARSDYGRACEVMDYAGVISCGSSRVLVLGDEPLRTTVMGIAEGITIVRCVSCTSADDAELALAAIPTGLLQLEAPKTMVIESERVVLFDSAYVLAAAPQAIEAVLAPGPYEVFTEKFTSPGLFEFIVHRMVRSSGSMDCRPAGNAAA